MIPGSFYPSDVTIADQNLDLTKYIMDIPITTEIFSDAYWLGWINYDNLPTPYHVSAYTYDTNSGACAFTDATAQNNYPVGYTCYYSTSNSTIFFTSPGYDTYRAPDGQTNYKWQDARACWGASWDSSRYMRLPNDLDVNTVAWTGIGINFYGRVTDGTDYASVSGRVDTTDLSLTGTFTVTFSKRYGSLTYNSVTMTLHYDSFDAGTYEFTDNGLTYKIAITNWETFVERDIKTDNTNSNYTNAKPTILVTDDTGYQHLIAIMGSPYTETGWTWGQGKFYNGCFLYPDGHIPDVSQGGCQFNIFDGNERIYGGFVGSFNLNDIVFNSFDTYFFDDANFLIASVGRSDFIPILRIYQIDDIRKCLALLPRQNTAQTRQTYANSADYQYAHVSDDNEFLCELIDGTHVADGLRDWQIVGNTITDSDFDPEDIPPYEPEPDDGADSGGDDSRPWDFVNTPLSATNNFVTLYALSTAQVSEFGAMMWAKLSDTAFWQSVGTVFLNDFSINPADMLKYFVSLRYFPFDLSNYSSSYANGIYIGRSTYPIQISTYPRRMARNLVEISGGSAQVILPQPYNTQDFRNCDPNTQVSVYVPYCGIVELSAAEVYGKYLDLRYYADMQTGALAASLCVRSDTYYEIATLAGSCGAEVPITANNNVEFLQRIATVASSGLGGTISGATNGAQIGGTPGAVAGGALGAITGSAQAMMALPPVSVHKSGKATGYATLGCDNQAHITIQISKPAVPDSFARTNGYISNKQARIGDLSGYTEMINPDTSGIDAHADELEKIKAILQTGFYA